MKKLLTTATILTLFASGLYESAQANFKFGDMFKGLKSSTEKCSGEF